MVTNIAKMKNICDIKGTIVLKHGLESSDLVFGTFMVAIEIILNAFETICWFPFVYIQRVLRNGAQHHVK